MVVAVALLLVLHIRTSSVYVCVYLFLSTCLSWALPCLQRKTWPSLQVGWFSDEWWTEVETLQKDRKGKEGKKGSKKGEEGGWRMMRGHICRTPHRSEHSMPQGNRQGRAHCMALVWTKSLSWYNKVLDRLCPPQAYHWGLRELGTSSCQCWEGLSGGCVQQSPTESEHVTVTWVSHDLQLTLSMH